MVYFYKRISGIMQELCGVNIEIDDHDEIESISDAIFCEHKYNKSL